MWKCLLLWDSAKGSWTVCIQKNLQSWVLLEASIYGKAPYSKHGDYLLGTFFKKAGLQRAGVPFRDDYTRARGQREPQENIPGQLFPKTSTGV